MKSSQRKNLHRPLGVVAATPVRPLAAPSTRLRSAAVHALILLALMVANFALYYGTLDIGFFGVDDADYVLNNPYIANLHSANLKHIFTTPYFANYAPANLLTYTLDVLLAGGKKAFAMHLSNVLWHGWGVCTVYLLALVWCDEVLAAVAAAALFLVHPTHVEVVAWISSRKDLVATGFAALSMMAYLLWRKRARIPAGTAPLKSGKSRWHSRHWWYAGSLLCFLLASAGKQSVLLLPMVMLVWDLLGEKRRDWRMLADKIPFGLITLFFGLMTWKAQPSTNQALSLFVLASTELSNLWLLTGLGQYVLYRPAPNPAAWAPAARLGIIALAAAIWLLPLLWWRIGARRQPTADITSFQPALQVTLCYWVLIQMIPPMVLNFIVPITDRYLFLPSIGVCLLAGKLAATLSSKLTRHRWIPVAIPVALACIWAGKTINYVEEWRDPRSVWYGAHLKTKTTHVFEYLGDAYQEAGERVNNFINSHTALAVTNELKLARVVLRDPNVVEALRVEWSGSAGAKPQSTAYRDKLWALAWEQFQQAVAHRGTVSAPNLFMNRGRLLVNQGKSEAAIGEFKTALQFAQTSTYNVVQQGTSTHALYAIGVAYWHLRDYKQAQQWLEKAQALQRKSLQAWIPALDKELERVKGLAATQ